MYYLKLNNLDKKYMLFIVHNHKETEECIKKIKAYEN